MNRSIAGILLVSAGWVQAATWIEGDPLEARAVRAAFLARPVGAGSAALGGAVAAWDSGAGSLFWNPAGLARLAARGAMAQHEITGADARHSALAAALPVGPGVAGLGAILSSAGAYDVRDEYGVKTGTESLNDLGISGGYAMVFIDDRLAAGAAAEFASEGAGGSVIAGSLGAVWRTGELLSLGVAIRHLGAGSDGFSPPSTADVGAAWAASPKVRAAAGAGFGLAAGEPWAGAGVEVAAHRMLSLRAGYRWSPAHEGLGGLTGVTAGLGARFAGFGFDYAFVPYGELATSHLVTLTWLGATPSAPPAPAASPASPPPAPATPPAPAARPRR